MGRLAGKVAAVTGAGLGIGRATALLFAREGATVAVLEVQDEEGKKIAEEIRGNTFTGHYPALIKIAERFEALDGSADDDDLNAILEALYDWGDTRLPPLKAWPSYRLCWIG